MTTSNLIRWSGLAYRASFWKGLRRCPSSWVPSSLARASSARASCYGGGGKAARQAAVAGH